MYENSRSRSTPAEIPKLSRIFSARPPLVTKPLNGGAATAPDVAGLQLDGH